MEKDEFSSRASNMEEDNPSSPDIHVESAKDISLKLHNEVRLMFSEQKSSESRSSECCIYRVPQSLRNVNIEAYTPQLIPIGPVHRENKEDMRKDKLKYFQKLTKRTGMDEEKTSHILISIKNQEERLRNCYSEKSMLMESSDDFANMILLDAIFIIQFFLESYDDENGPRSFKPRMTSDIREDLMLLENQLPLFIIEEIYVEVSKHSLDNRHKSFLDLATCYLRDYLHLEVVETSPGVERRHHTGCRDLMLCNTRLDIKKETSPGVKKDTRHLTDLLRDLMLSRAIQRNYSPDLVKLKYSAIMLHKAGVRFQVTRDKCLVNIKFDNGVLKIPQLKVDHNFERLVRNAMAMEECLYEGEAYICSYIKFMDQLVDSAGDVGLLVQKDIILHWLGDDAAVSTMINNFCKNIGDNDTCFGDISKELNAHYENRCNHRKATLKLHTININFAVNVTEPVVKSEVRPEISVCFTEPADMKNHAEQASASNMEDDESSSPNKGKGIDVVGSDSDIDYTNTERDDKLSASNKGKDIAITSSISNLELKIEMTSRIMGQLNDKMKELPLKQNRAHCCIYRVPKSLRNINWKPYTPLLISIGPLHRETRRIQAMQNHKWRCFKEFAGEDGMNKEKIKDLVVIIQNEKNYIKFMDHLIDGTEDMGLLVENGIILHWLGDDAAVSNMINNFCENIGDNYTCFGDISQELNAHYENRWNHRKATLKLVYFPNIWRADKVSQLFALPDFPGEEAEEIRSRAKKLREIAREAVEEEELRRRPKP
uniref:Uncharacterized protein n=1 Tax=Salix viminalis TaxID=40686 RepID=A0A6N2L347_SALVM